MCRDTPTAAFIPSSPPNRLAAAKASSFFLHGDQAPHFHLISASTSHSHPPPAKPGPFLLWSLCRLPTSLLVFWQSSPTSKEHTSACPVFLPSSFICLLPSLCPFASMTLCSSLPGPVSAKGCRHAQKGGAEKGPFPCGWLCLDSGISQGR